MFGWSSDARTFGFPQEPFVEQFVCGALARQHLERDLAPESLVERPIDDAHPTAAKDFLDPV